MIKISSKDIQEASKKFQIFLKDVIKNYIKSGLLAYYPDDITLAKKHGLKYLGSGVYRVAYKYKNVVIKTHLSYGSNYDITEEHALWNKYKNSFSASILNPILFCKTINFKKADVEVTYSISPYVKTHRSAKKTEKHKNYRKLLNIVSSCIYDGHTGNIGVLNKLPILIDYQDGDVCFDKDELNTKEINLFNKQRNTILKLVQKASA